MEVVMARSPAPEARIFDAQGTARRILRLARTGALATSGPEGHPFASLVSVAATMSGEPVLLLSDLALHTQNLTRDDRASLLVAAPGDETGDSLAGDRLSIVGRLVRTDRDTHSARRFLARHRDARRYAGFADFAFYRMDVSSAHLVAGFGRIATLTSEELLLDLTNCDELVAAEPDAVAHMNADHADAIRLYATRLCGAPDGDWWMSGLDPAGADLVCDASGVARLDFPGRITTPRALRTVLGELAGRARA